MLQKDDKEGMDVFCQMNWAIEAICIYILFMLDFTTPFLLSASSFSCLSLFTLVSFPNNFTSNQQEELTTTSPSDPRHDFTDLYSLYLIYLLPILNVIAYSSALNSLPNQHSFNLYSMSFYSILLIFYLSVKFLNCFVLCIYWNLLTRYIYYLCFIYNFYVLYCIRRNYYFANDNYFYPFNSQDLRSVIYEDIFVINMNTVLHYEPNFKSYDFSCLFKFQDQLRLCFNFLYLDGQS